MKRLLAIALLAGCGPKVPAPEALAPPCPIEVGVGWPGASAAEVEAAVVEPIEAALAGLPGLVSMQSAALEGHARLRIRLDGPPEAGLAAVRSALDAARPKLPSEAETPTLLAPRGPRTLTVLVMRARDTDDLRTLRARADDLARRVNAEVLAPGRAEAVLTLDPARLRATGLDLRAVLAALSRPSETPRGFVVEGAVAGGDLATLLDAVVAAPQGVPIRLRDLATAELRMPPLPTARYDGAPAAVLLVEGAAPPAEPNVVAFGPLTLDACAPAALPAVTGAAALARLDVPRPEPELLLAAANAVATPGALVLAGAGLAGGDVEVLAKPEAADALRRATRATPGLAGAVAVPGERRLTLVLTHPDTETLVRAATAATDALRARPEVADVAVQGATTRPEIRVEARRPEARPADLALALRAATEGVDAARLMIGAESVTVRVRLGRAARPEDVADIPVPLSGGGAARLGDVADVTQALATTRIVRLDRARAALVTAALRENADAAAIGKDAAERLRGELAGLRVDVR